MEKKILSEKQLRNKYDTYAARVRRAGNKAPSYEDWLKWELQFTTVKG